MTRLGPATTHIVRALQIGHCPRRYHFNLQDGDTLLRDHKGVYLPNNEAALRRAEQLARGFKWICWSIHVTDEEGNAIGSVR